MSSPSIVVWDVGGTLVVRAVSITQAVAEALQAAAIRPEQLGSDSIQRAQREYQESWSLWATPEDAREGFRDVAAVLLAGSPATADPHAVREVGDRLGDGTYR